MKALVCTLLFVSPLSAQPPERIVSVGGAATETVFALGAGKSLVGVDTSSVFPENHLPQVGYQRTLSAEGILSLHPDLVILSATAGPPQAIEQLEKTGVPMLRLPDGYTLEAAAARINKIGEAIGKIEVARELCRKMEKDSAAILPPQPPPPKVLFVMSAGGGAPMAAGTGTAADAVIRLSGGRNVGSEFEGYKQLSPETLVTLDPEIVVTTSRTVKEKDLSSAEWLPGLAATPAGRNSRIIIMDDLYLLGFGPRTGEALAEFSKKLAACRLNAGQ